MKHKSHLFAAAVLIWGVLALPANRQALGQPSAASSFSTAVDYRLPGEFEAQRALLIGCREFAAEMPNLLADLVAHTEGRVELVMLVNDAAEQRLAEAALQQRGVRARHVHFVQVKHDTMWCRDYGPILVQAASGKTAVVDADYGCEGRDSDDEVPFELGRRLHLPTVSTSLRLEGGNLLSNGRGLCLTTTRVLDANEDSDESSIHGAFRRLFGAALTVFLTPLAHEPTGHVDMFATFTSPDTVVVASYDPDVDAENAAILNDNARRLAQLRVGGRPLRVARVPMPPRVDEQWRTYTNVAYANGILLLPGFPDAADSQQIALDTFSALLPKWRVIPVDAREIAKYGGAVHCLTMNLGPLKHLPAFPVVREAPSESRKLEDDSVFTRRWTPAGGLGGETKWAGPPSAAVGFWR